jgi:hypothetical protein
LRESIRALVEGRGDYGYDDLLSRVCAHDAALQMGFTVTYRDLTAEEFIALRLLRQERAKQEQQNGVREESMEIGRQSARTGKTF